MAVKRLSSGLHSRVEIRFKALVQLAIPQIVVPFDPLSKSVPVKDLLPQRNAAVR